MTKARIIATAGYEAAAADKSSATVFQRTARLATPTMASCGRAPHGRKVAVAVVKMMKRSEVVARSRVRMPDAAVVMQTSIEVVRATGTPHRQRLGSRSIQKAQRMVPSCTHLRA